MTVGNTRFCADRRLTDWQDEGQERFGIFTFYWFICPECGLAHQPYHAMDVGIAYDRLGATCPADLGGCGFPHTMGTLLAPTAKYKALNTPELARLGRMVSLAKDGTSVALRVFPFCPDDMIPADGNPAKVPTTDAKDATDPPQDAIHATDADAEARDEP